MIILLIALSVFAYFVGGEKWGNTKIRDWGVPTCIFGLMWFIYGFSLSYVIGFLIAWAGLSIGDDVKGNKWYWSLHGFVTSLCMFPYAVVNQEWLVFPIMVICVTGLTYLVSKFLNMFYVDVILRGLLYATIPLWFIIKI